MASAGPPPSAAFLVMALGRRMRERVERTLKGEGITMRHLSALGHLSRDSGISYSELARRASVTPQSMQATLAKLEECGAVSRTTDSGRGRTARLVVTDEGVRLLALGQDAIRELDEVLGRHLDADTLEKLMPGLLRAMLALGDDERG